MRREGPSGVVRLPFSLGPLVAMRLPLNDTVVPRPDDLVSDPSMGRRALAPMPPGCFGDAPADESDLEEAVQSIEYRIRDRVGRAAARLISTYVAWELGGWMPAPGGIELEADGWVPPQVTVAVRRAFQGEGRDRRKYIEVDEVHTLLSEIRGRAATEVDVKDFLRRVGKHEDGDGLLSESDVLLGFAHPPEKRVPSAHDLDRGTSHGCLEDDDDSEYDSDDDYDSEDDEWEELDGDGATAVPEPRPDWGDGADYYVPPPRIRPEQDPRFCKPHVGGPAVPLLQRNAMFDCLNQASRPLRGLLTAGNLLMMWGFLPRRLAEEDLPSAAWGEDRVAMLAWRDAVVARLATCIDKATTNARTQAWWSAKSPVLLARREATAPVRMCRHRPPMLHLSNEVCTADLLRIPQGATAGVFVLDERLNLGPGKSILDSCREMNLRLAIVIAKDSSKLSKQVKEAFWLAQRDEGIHVRYFKHAEIDSLKLGHWVQPAFRLLDPEGQEARAARKRAGTLEIPKLTSEDAAVRMLGVPVGTLLAIHVA